MYIYMNIDDHIYMHILKYVICMADNVP